MKFYKRTDITGKTTTVESYSHGSEIAGAVEIGEAEYQAFIIALPAPVEDAKEKKRREAKERAIAAIKANQTGAPWGKILLDMAIAQGWLEEYT